MKEYADKLLMRGRLYLIVSVVSCALFFFTAIWGDFMDTGLQGFFILLFALCAMLSLLVFYVQYSVFMKCFKLLKENGNESFLDDIHLDLPTFAYAEIYCGNDAFYCKRRNLVIPYAQIAWIYSSDGSTEEYMFALKNSVKVEVKISQNDLRSMINQYISLNNPDLMIGETEQNRHDYHAKYDHPTSVFIRRGFILIGIAAFLMIVGLINRTLNVENGILILIIFGVGTGFLVYGKQHDNILETFNNLMTVIRTSQKIGFAIKAMTVTNLVSVIGILVFALLDVQSLGMICFAMYFLSVIPFIASVFLKLGFFEKKEEAILLLPKEVLDDYSYILKIDVHKIESFYRYSFILSGRYGWDYMLNSVDYLAEVDVEEFLSVKVGNLVSEKDVTESYLENGKASSKTPELSYENNKIILSGYSKVLKEPIQIIWFNQTNALQLLLPMDDTDFAERYVETLVRRSFGTKDAMKSAKPVPQPKQPVEIVDGMIRVNSSALQEWNKKTKYSKQYEVCAVIPLTQREPLIAVYEDGVKTREYCLQTEGEEDFTGKYFHISARAGAMGVPPVPILQVDGFISDTEEERKMKLGDIGYRMEGQVLACGGKLSEMQYEKMRGQDLVAKGLKYPGYTTPSNVRLIGVCSDCGKSFAFHGYAFYMTQADVAYSDDGLDCYVIYNYNIDPATWTCEVGGKTFRYYNAFACPHCGAPYIDYKKYPENKKFGVSGCVHLGRKHYEEKLS